MIITRNDQMQHTVIYMRFDRLSVGRMDKVRDHCHIFGNFRGTAHNECILSFVFILIKLKY